MNKKLEDSLGKLAMVLVFGYLTAKQTAAVFGIISNSAEIYMWQLTLTSLIFGTTFMFMVLYFTMARLPPIDSAAGLEPRITAITGTFIMTLLLILPAGTIGVELRVTSTVLIIIGTVLSIYCIRQLGRSFSIMATARELVTQGPYKVIRHPLYGAEVVTIIGVAIGHWSPGAALLALAWLALQIRRAQNEERVLRASFPEYEAYARLVPMLLPGFILPRGART